MFAGSICLDMKRSMANRWLIDSLRRHEKTHTKGTTEPTPRIGKACDRCHALKARCDKGNPCAVCAKRGLQCTFDRNFKRESRSASILSGTDYEEMQAGRKRRRVDQDIPDRLLGLNGLVDAVSASASSYTPTPPPPSYTTGTPSKIHQTQSQAEEVSMQNLRVAVRQHEAQIQHDLMNVGDQPPPPPPAQHPHQEEDAEHHILRLSRVYSESKSFLVADNVLSDLESEEMTDLMGQLDAKYYVELYFSHFHGQWPFLTRPQFNPEIEPSILVLAMVMCGLRMTEEKSLMRLAWAIHAHLQAIIVTQMDNWTVKEYSSHRWPIATYQAILLFTIFAITANDYTEIFGSDEEEDEEDVIDRIYPIFTRLVDTCRIQRILHYPSMLSQIHADDPLVYKLCASEEFKYFALTLFKVDNILSKLIQLGRDNNNDDSDDMPDATGYTALSISDLQFPPPVNNYLWEADGIREFLRRRTRQCRDPSRSSEVYTAVMADDRETSLNRELNPWICDILLPTEKDAGEMQGKRLGRKRRKAWVSLGPWLGYLVGLDVGSARI
ncbi:Transcription factor [Penicillium occitanis (nom. inval.)]|nr:hypothetical protein PENOC_106000 [Penicillium occitanis (nom. inval.)]PCG93101.1 Transcription factor [Penicillium occitanis (nom. inval.)]